MKKLLYMTIAAVALLLPSSCTDDLDQMPHTETTSAQVYATAANYKSVLGKLYASFVITGQEKNGNEDLSSNKGLDYIRCYINLQECGTDEIAYTWAEGDNMGNVVSLSWDANDVWVSDTYYRIYYTVALCNKFIRYASDDKIAKFTDDEQADIRAYKAEARFLRALAYYHAMDLYLNVPFVDENDAVGAFTPPRYTASQIFSFIANELTSIEEELPTRTEAEYGHASQGAAWTLLARMYLNAETYTGTGHYTDCITYCNKVIGAGYSLETDGYTKLFNADNHKRTNEIIFPFVVDHINTVSWGASTYMVCGSVSSTSEYQIPATTGVANGWGSFRARQELPAKFGNNDQRALFFTEGQTLSVDEMGNPANGYLVTKWTNLTDAGETASNTATDGVDTDFPVFRLADVYLMLAESVVKGGSGSNLTDALYYVNEIRKRAYGDNYETDGKVTASALTESFILDERARELYWEGVRRTNLIRHDKFTTADYLWQWKGGVKDGQAVESKYNYYPIPATDLTANPNLYNSEY
ncbi:MAG: RagB/SusD family nutrient uptake outer membrane protein [Breznakibacter sp.]